MRSQYDYFFLYIMSPEELGRVLTIAGFELEELIDLRANADGVVVGKVMERSLM